MSGALAALNTQLSGLIQALIDESEFTAKVGTSAVIRIGTAALRKVALVGLGGAEGLTLETLRRAGATMARLSQREKCSTLGISLPVGSANPAMAAQAIAEGAILALHEDKRFKSDTEDSSFAVERIELLGQADAAAAVQTAEQIASGVILARELVNAPPNVVTPEQLAQTAQDIATAHGLTLEILEKADCERLGMGAYLGVAQASDLPPKFIHLTYRPPGTPRRKVAIVGKGLTFDSGGLNIKAGAGSMIEMMKFDMGGGSGNLGGRQGDRPNQARCRSPFHQRHNGKHDQWSRPAPRRHSHRLQRQNH